MRNQHCALALALVIVVAAALAAIFHQSRTFTQIMGQDYDPERIDHVQVFLSAMDHDTPSREVFLTPEDPATQTLLDLLNGSLYEVQYAPVWANTDRSVRLDYIISMTIVMDPEDGGYPYADLRFRGCPEAEIHGVNSVWPRWIQTYYRADSALQQEILDLLLAQPYQEVP